MSMGEQTTEPSEELKALIMAQDATDEPDAVEGGEADGDR